MSADILTPPAADGKDLKKNIFSGLYWSAVGRVLQQTIQFGLSVGLARLLSPGDFGTMTMVGVFTGFAAMLADVGFSGALIQKESVKEIHFNTVFWTNVALSLSLTLLVVLLAPWLAAFYKDPALIPIFRCIAFNFTIGSLGAVHGALLQKRMQFKAITQVGTYGLLLSGLTGLTLAWFGAGVWSLVAQSLLSTSLIVILRWNACRWLPKFEYCFSALRYLWSYSGSLYGFNFMNYWARSADALIIGKVYGAESLGFYNRAYALMCLPISQVNSVIAQVVFPAFASIQNDKEKVKRIYLRAMGMTAFIMFPVMMGLSVTARPFIETVYGHKWLSVAPILQILALVGMLQTIGNTVGWLFTSQGETGLMLKWGAAYSVSTLLSFFVGVEFGSVKAIAWCYAVVNIIFIYPELNSACAIVGMKAIEVLAKISGSFIISLAMCLAVSVVNGLLPLSFQPWLRLGTLVLAGTVFYLGTSIAFRSSALEDIRMMVMRKRGGGQST
jgi:PST family polysaccharide transporter